MDAHCVCFHLLMTTTVRIKVDLATPILTDRQTYEPVILTHNPVRLFVMSEAASCPLASSNPGVPGKTLIVGFSITEGQTLVPLTYCPPLPNCSETCADSSHHDIILYQIQIAASQLGSR